MRGTNLSGKTLVLAANDVKPVSITGKYILILACSSATMSLSVDGGEEVPIAAGLAIPTDELFTNLLFKDTSGGGTVVTFLTSLQPIAFFPPQTNVISKGAATYTKGTGAVALGAGATADFTGLDGAKVRKQFTLTNLDAGANILQVLDGNGVIFAEVYPQRLATWEISGDIKVKNPNGGGVNYAVGEIFYL